MKRTLLIILSLLPLIASPLLVQSACAQSSASSGPNADPDDDDDDDDGDCDGSSADNSSVEFKLQLGTTAYQKQIDFVSNENRRRKPRFSNYSPPIVDPPVEDESLSATWRSRMERNVSIGLVTDNITDATFTPAGIELYSGSAGKAWIKKDANGALRQILTDQYLTDITVPSGGGVLVTLYLRNSIGALDSASGLYSVSSALKFRTATISEPADVDPGDYGISTSGSATYRSVDIAYDEYALSQSKVSTVGYRWFLHDDSGVKTSVLTHHNGVPSLMNVFMEDRLVKTQLPNSVTQTERMVSHSRVNAAPVIVSNTREKYVDLGDGTRRIVERVEAPGTPEELSTHWTYSDLTATTTVDSTGVVGSPDPGGTQNRITGGRMLSLRRSDGYWEDYSYQYNGLTRIMLINKWSAWKNSQQGDHANSRHEMITLEENKRTVIEEICGQIVSNIYETLTVASDGSRTLREERQTGSGAALITEKAYFPNEMVEPHRGRLKYVRNPDGTLTRYTYSLFNGNLKTIIEEGSAGAGQFPPAATGAVPALTDGTKTVRLHNTMEQVVDQKVYDIATGLLLSQYLVTASDIRGRPEYIIHDGDTDDYETFTYACCGVDTHRARDGSVTHYTRDGLKRPVETTVSVGSRTTTTTYVYDSEVDAGRTLPRTRINRLVAAGGNTASLFVTETVENLRRQTLVSRTADSNGDGNPETTVTSHDPATRTRTVTGPDGLSTITTEFADGQPHTSVTLSGSTPVTPLTTYNYNPHDTNGGGIATSVQLSAGGSPFKTSHSFTNLAGRVFRSEFPGYNGSTLVTTTSFDERGRVVGQSSTGKPGILRVLDFKGQPLEFWTDSNGDGQFNNTIVGGIKDSVILSDTDFVTENGIICQRARQWIRDDANQDILTSTSFRATNGTWSKVVPLSGTSPATLTIASKRLNGNATRETRSYLNGSDFLSSVTTTIMNGNGAITTLQINKDTSGNTVSMATQNRNLLDRVVASGNGRTPATIFSEFTASGTPRKTIAGDGSYTITTLDSASRPEKTETYNAQNALIATVHTRYDALGRVTANFGTNTTPTYKFYDLEGRLKELRTYRSSNLAIAPDATTAGYDSTIWNFEPSTGYLLGKRDATNKGADYTYTTDGKLYTRTCARGVVTTYAYDAAGRLLSTSYTNDPANTPNISITYDRLGRKITESNNVATTIYAYDPATLQPDTETITYDFDGQPGADFTRVHDRSRDAIGRDTGWQLKDGGTVEHQATYGYNATDGRLTSVTSPLGNFSYLYTSGSNLLAQITGPVHAVFNTWEPNRDILDLKENKIAGVTVSSFDYAVNALGQRETVATSGSAFPALQSWVWGYDPLGQIVSANHSTDDGFDRAYQYDAIGNRIESRDGAINFTGNPNYSANSLNQYSLANGVNLPPTPVPSPYDEDGNLRFDGGVNKDSQARQYVWDAENRLVEVLDVSGQQAVSLVTCAYDAQSRRISRSMGVPSTNSMIYLYDGWNCIAEYTFSNNQFSICQSYLWGLDLSGSLQGAGGVGGLLAVKIGGTSYYPTCDGNGNVSEYLNIAGDIKAHFEYDPFGRTLPSIPLASEDATVREYLTYRFSTKPLDSEIGWYYYAYRHYDPATGRWPSRDPIEENGGVNLYRFVSNSPIKAFDALGLKIQLTTRYDTMSNIVATYGVLSYTGEAGTPSIATPQSTGQTTYDNKIENGECCAKIKEASYLEINVETVYPSDWGNPTNLDGEFYALTNQGYQSTISHENRRRNLYKDANNAFLKPVEGQGAKATQCGWICDETYSAAESRLANYLSALQAEATNGYNLFVGPNSYSIGSESLDMREVIWPINIGGIVVNGPVSLIYGYTSAHSWSAPNPTWQTNCSDY